MTQSASSPSELGVGVPVRSAGAPAIEPFPINEAQARAIIGHAAHLGSEYAGAEDVRRQILGLSKDCLPGCGDVHHWACKYAGDTDDVSDITNAFVQDKGRRPWR